MLGRVSGNLRGQVLRASVVVAIACSAPPARAECGDFGGLGVMLGATGGLGASLVGSFLYPGIALAAKPGLSYWSGFGYTLAAGATGTVLGTLAVSDSCPYPGSLYVPALVAAPVGALTTVVWAATSRPKPPPVSVAVATPAWGRGAVLSVGGAF